MVTGSAQKDSLGTMKALEMSVGPSFDGPETFITAGATTRHSGRGILEG
jgi:hypothetical protein